MTMHLDLKNNRHSSPNLQGMHGNVMLRRLFSEESTISSNRLSGFQFAEVNIEEHVCSVEFFLKLIQLLFGVISAGLYSEGHKAMLGQYVSSLMFPNVVHSAYIIITSVIAISYVLGQTMPAVLIRVFNFIAVVLYSISASIISHTWLITNSDSFISNMLFAQVIANFMAVVFYVTDLWLSIKKALYVPEYVNTQTITISV